MSRSPKFKPSAHHRALCRTTFDVHGNPRPNATLRKMHDEFMANPPPQTRVRVFSDEEKSRARDLLVEFAKEHFRYSDHIHRHLPEFSYIVDHARRVEMEKRECLWRSVPDYIQARAILMACGEPTAKLKPWWRT